MGKEFKATYYETPRHGYLAVQGDDAREVQISQSFSGYSYYDEDGDIFYLEEDCDMPMFLKRCELDGVEVITELESLDEDEVDEKIYAHNNAEGGDYGYFGELKQNTEGLNRFFSDYLNDEEDVD
jgi:hypothetical protein